MIAPSKEAASYQPREGTLPYRVINYFRRLPDEELSVLDIGQKFDAVTGNVHTQLKAAVDCDILARDGKIYSAGPQIGTLPALVKPITNAFGSPVNTATAPQAQPAAEVKSRAPRIMHFDASAIVIDDDVPVITNPRGQRDKWGPLLQRLTSVGQSFKLPIDKGGAIGAAISKYHKGAKTRFTRAIISDTELRVWRVL